MGWSERRERIRMSQPKWCPQGGRPGHPGAGLGALPHPAHTPGPETVPPGFRLHFRAHIRGAVPDPLAPPTGKACLWGLFPGRCPRHVDQRNGMVALLSQGGRAGW